MSDGLSPVVLYLPSPTDFGDDPELKDERLNRHLVEDHPTLYTTREGALDAALMAASVVPTDTEWPSFLENLASAYGGIPSLADLYLFASCAPKTQAFVLKIAFGDVIFGTERDLDSQDSLDIGNPRSDPDIIWLIDDYMDNDSGKLGVVTKRNLLGRFELLQVGVVQPRLRPPLE